MNIKIIKFLSLEPCALLSLKGASACWAATVPRQGALALALALALVGPPPLKRGTEIKGKIITTLTGRLLS